MDYTLIRSSRRTLAIQIGREGQLIVRAPRLYPVYLIERFIEAKKTWIEKNTQKAEKRKQKAERRKYSETEIREMKKRLMEYIRVRIPELWEGQGLPKYTSIKVTKSDKRWGSCSGKNGLCFSYRLAEHLEVPVMSTESPDSVVTTRHLAQDTRKTEQDFSLRFTSLEMTETNMHPSFIDAVIVHELAHLREKHHQPKFWKLVYEIMPDYETIMRDQKNLD